eukprot:scaffold75374_cov69-Phaeocystis_antarctica.AAC.2
MVVATVPGTMEGVRTATVGVSGCRAHMLACSRPTSMTQGGGQSLLVRTEWWSLQDCTKVEAKGKRNGKRGATVVGRAPRQ